MVSTLGVDEIALLRDLDLAGLRARWRGVFSSEAPGHLPKHLLISIERTGIAAGLERCCQGLGLVL